MATVSLPGAAEVSAAEVSAAEVSAAEVILQAEGLPEYGTPGDSFASDSNSLVVASGSLTIGLSSNLSNLTQPASTILYAGEISQTPNQVAFTNSQNVSSGIITQASRVEPTNFTDIHMQNDGGALIALTNVNGNLYKSVMGTAFNMTGTMDPYTTPVDTASVFTITGTTSLGVWVNPAGTRIWVSTSTQMRMATMATPFDYANMVDSGQAQTIGASTNNWSCCLTPDEKFVLVVDNTAHTLKIWELTTPGSLAAWTLRHTLNLNSLFGFTSPSGVVIDVWRKKIYIGFRTGDVIRQFSWT